MPLISLAVQHRRTEEEARRRLETAVHEISGKFGAMLRRVEWAAASRQAHSQAIARTLAGLVWTRRGHLEEAMHPLERSLDTCREKNLAVWQPIPASVLGLTLVLLGRVEEGLPLLEDG